MLSVLLANLKFGHQRTNQKQASKHQNATQKQHPPCLPHLRDWRVNHSIIEKFHHHKLFQSHQVFLVCLIDALDESNREQIQVTGKPGETVRETSYSNLPCTCKTLDCTSLGGRNMHFYHQPPFNVLTAFSLLPGCKEGMGLPCLPRGGRGFTHLKGNGWTKHVSYLHQPLQKSAVTQELLCHGQVSFTNLPAKTLCTLLGCRAKNAPPETPAKLLPGRTNINELTGKAFALLLAFNHQPDSYSLLIYVSQKDAVFPVVVLLQRVVPIFCLYQAGGERNQRSDRKPRASQMGPATIVAA